MRERIKHMTCEQEGHPLSHEATHEGRGIFHKCRCGARQFFGMAAEGDCEECDTPSFHGDERKEGHRMKCETCYNVSESLSASDMKFDSTICDACVARALKDPIIGYEHAVVLFLQETLETQRIKLENSIRAFWKHI